MSMHFLRQCANVGTACLLDAVVWKEKLIITIMSPDLIYISLKEKYGCNKALHEIKIGTPIMTFFVEAQLRYEAMLKKLMH